MLMGVQSPGVVITITAALCTLNLVALALRFLVRRRLRQNVKVDDWCVSVSMVLVLGLCICVFVGVADRALADASFSRGDDGELASSQKFRHTARLQFIYFMISVPAHGFIKMSFVLFYRRLFLVDKTIQRCRNIYLHGLAAVVISCTVAFFMAILFSCRGHVAAWWQPPETRHESCIDISSMLLAFTISDFVTDVMIIATPMPWIWKLRLPVTRKLEVLTVFLLGGLAVIASLIRMIWMAWIHHRVLDSVADQDLRVTTMLFWCMVEVSLGLLAASLPSLRLLFWPCSLGTSIPSSTPSPPVSIKANVADDFPVEMRRPDDAEELR